MRFFKKLGQAMIDAEKERIKIKESKSRKLNQEIKDDNDDAYEVFLLENRLSNSRNLKAAFDAGLESAYKSSSKILNNMK